MSRLESYQLHGPFNSKLASMVRHTTNNNKLFFLFSDFALWADAEGGQGVRTPPEKSLNIGFSSNTGPDPLKIAATKSAFNVGPSFARQRNAGGPMMAR